MMRGISRKGFLKTAVLAGGAIGFPAVVPSAVLGKNGSVSPSNRITVGLIGCGRRSGVGGEYNMVRQSKLLAVCDPVKWRREASAAEWNVPDAHNDFRDVLARDDIDAVHIVTPDHWHVPIALMAARAGKDMYVEKPLSLCIGQSLAAREITEKHGRVFQYGTQQRSMRHLRMGIEIVLNGHIGNVKEVYVWCPGGAKGGSATPELPVPEGFDYELWTGPAPMKPFCEDRCSPHGPPKATYFCYDYSIGMLGGWGAHPVDQLQWWADAENKGIPVEYKTTGSLPTEGLFNTVVTWQMEATYADGTKLYFMDSKTARASQEIPGIEKLKQFGNCTVFVGEEGWVAVSREGMLASTEALRRKAKDPGPRKLQESSWHPIAFVDAIRNGTQPVSSLDSAIRSDIICHMGDLCVRTGKTLGWDAQKEMVTGSAEAVKMMHRTMRDPWTL
ncbi:Gfo/Idh/MocA family oxidoreductase [Verrucomicrobia bacterium S94]|nr:Gfo/Idh/MocA family oxidoreductase [Verrucomicrobia bacterium S94]